VNIFCQHIFLLKAKKINFDYWGGCHVRKKQKKEGKNGKNEATDVTGGRFLPFSSFFFRFLPGFFTMCQASKQESRKAVRQAGKQVLLTYLLTYLSK